MSFSWYLPTLGDSNLFWYLPIWQVKIFHHFNFRFLSYFWGTISFHIEHWHFILSGCWFLSAVYFSIRHCFEGIFSSSISRNSLYRLSDKSLSFVAKFLLSWSLTLFMEPFLYRSSKFWCNPTSGAFIMASGFYFAWGDVPHHPLFLLNFFLIKPKCRLLSTQRNSFVLSSIITYWELCKPHSLPGVYSLLL